MIAHNWLIRVNYQRKNKIGTKTMVALLFRIKRNMQISNR